MSAGRGRVGGQAERADEVTLRRPRHYAEHRVRGGVAAPLQDAGGDAVHYVVTADGDEESLPRLQRPDGRGPRTVVSHHGEGSKRHAPGAKLGFGGREVAPGALGRTLRVGDEDEGPKGADQREVPVPFSLANSSKKRLAVGPRCPWYLLPLPLEPYGRSAGEVSRSLLREDGTAPLGLRLDADAAVAAFRTAWDVPGGAVVLLEASDLARLGVFERRPGGSGVSPGGIGPDRLPDSHLGRRTLEAGHP